MNIEERIELIDFENQVYLLLIFATLINYNTNLKLKNIYLQKKKIDESIREQYLFANYIGLLVFVIFLFRNNYTLSKLNENDEDYEIAKLRVFGSYLFISGQLTVIYYLMNTSSFTDSPL